MFGEYNVINFNNGGLNVPSITVNIKMSGQASRRNRRAICIDGINFYSFDSAVNYLMGDGMTSKEALSYLSRKEMY